MYKMPCTDLKPYNTFEVVGCWEGRRLVWRGKTFVPEGGCNHLYICYFVDNSEEHYVANEQFIENIRFQSPTNKKFHEGVLTDEGLLECPDCGPETELEWCQQQTPCLTIDRFCTICGARIREPANPNPKPVEKSPYVYYAPEEEQVFYSTPCAHHPTHNANIPSWVKGTWPEIKLDFSNTVWDQNISDFTSTFKPLDKYTQCKGVMILPYSGECGCGYATEGQEIECKVYDGHVTAECKKCGCTNELALAPKKEK